MEGLPKLPGLDFENRHRLNHSVSHCFDYRNGYRIPRPPPIGIGGETRPEDSIAFVPEEDAVLFDPALTYGRVQKYPAAPFRPNYVLYDKIILTFRGFFKQSVAESPLEHYRIRHVNIMYFMEDDTISVIEPKVLNCGFPQGRLVRRCKIPKNVKMEYYTWKDLNVGIDIELMGIVYHICDCDEFTKEFIAAQGVELNEIECSPVDPYTSTNLINQIKPMRKTPSDDDKLRRYLEFQGKVLTFDCVLDETDRHAGECMTYKMYYFLEDDTVAVKELKENSEGRDHFPMLLKRMKLPKNWKQRPTTFPSCFLETSDKEINEYYQPKDFRIGETIFVYGRRFLLLDCDKFTRKYFADVLKEAQGNPLSIQFPKETIPKRSIPEYLGLGTPEDSLASCFALTPKPPKKDIICYLANANKTLRFGCVLDTAHPEDQMRQFILIYSLADGKIKINEPPIRNSGIQGGKFLNSTLVRKPGCDSKIPEYYTAKDFYIGAVLVIFNHRFRIVSADLFVYRFMQQHPEMFSPEAIDGVRNYLLANSQLHCELQEAMKEDCLEYQQDKKEKEKTVEKEMTDMEKCLQNVHVYNPEDNDDVNTKKYQKNTPTSNDFIRDNNPDIDSGGDNGKKQNSDYEDNKQSTLLQLPSTDNKYLSTNCTVPTSECNNKKKRVEFDKKAMCSHKRSMGNCLTCCSN